VNILKTKLTEGQIWYSEKDNTIFYLLSRDIDGDWRWAHLRRNHGELEYGVSLATSLKGCIIKDEFRLLGSLHELDLDSFIAEKLKTAKLLSR
jgi:hypothetical protein